MGDNSDKRNIFISTRIQFVYYSCDTVIIYINFFKFKDNFFYIRFIYT